MAFKVPEQYRITFARRREFPGLNPRYFSDASYGNLGAFLITELTVAPPLYCIAGEGDGWEHVSVSAVNQKRCPTWEEMCLIKSLFWGENDCVLQYHPPKKDYVNHHPYCLHLWREIGKNFKTPPSYMVGPS